MINYEEIDALCRPMVRYFNSIGLKTKYSCQGHDNFGKNEFWIMFENEVSDSQTLDFIEKISIKRPRYTMGRFVKWARKYNGKIHANWMYEIINGNCFISQQWAGDDLERMKERVDGNK